LAGADTAGARIDFLHTAVAKRSNPLQIRVEAPFIDIMGMAHIVAHQGTFSTYIAYFGHF